MSAAPEHRRYFIRRPDECFLILIALSATAVLSGAAVISLLPDHPPGLRDAIPFAVFLISALLAHLILVGAGSRTDPVLLPVWIMLSGTGLAFQFRLETVSGDAWTSPGTWAHVAAPVLISVTACVFSRGRLKVFERCPWLWISAALAICLAVLATGVQYRGAVFGPGKTTPTESVKLLLILGFSGLLTFYGRFITRGTPLLSSDSRRVHIMLLGGWLAIAATLAMLRDLGMIAATGLLLGVMLTVATFRWIYPVSGVGLIVLASLLLQAVTGKGKARFGAWLDPFENPDTNGFQIIRSLFAIFNGEFLGKGIGNGFPKTIPLVETDFIYALLAEELGWIGTGMLLVLVAVIARRSLRAAATAGDPFLALVAVGSGAMWLIQAMLHAGGVIKLLPMTGVPFPGLSAGGTSIIVFSILLGWIMAVSDPPVSGKPKSRSRR